MKKKVKKVTELDLLLAMQKVHLEPCLPETAVEWYDEEDAGSWHIGHPDYQDRAALIYIIEAARSVCGMEQGDAIRLLGLALGELCDRA